MAILEPGTFKTSDYRKPIPDWVKNAATMRYLRENGGIPRDDDQAQKLARELQFDHRPPLNARQFDTETGDFIPPQNCPDLIFAVLKPDHDERTFGRKAGAARTVTTRSSDVGEAKRIKKIQRSHALHKAKMAAKAGQPIELSQALDLVHAILKLKDRYTIGPKRKLRSRNNLRREA